MNIALTFKNFEPSEHLRAYATRRFEKLGRFVSKADNITMTVVLTVDKFRHKADVQFSGDSVNISAMEQSNDMYATVDMVLDKLEVQLKKQAERIKEKRRARARDMDFTPVQEGQGESPELVREKGKVKVLFVEEALAQLDQSDNEVLVFMNEDTDRINVLYRRKNGGFGLIDPQE